MGRLRGGRGGGTEPPPAPMVEVPTALPDVILRALAKNPDDRQPSAAAFARDRELVVLHRGLRSRPVPDHTGRSVRLSAGRTHGTTGSTTPVLVGAVWATSEPSSAIVSRSGSWYGSAASTST